MEDQSAKQAFSAYIKKPNLNQQKLNQMGQQRQFFTNQLEVKYIGQKEIYQYAISFTPAVPSDARDLIQDLVKQAKKDESFIQKLGEKTFMSGESLYSFKQFNEPVFIGAKKGEEEYQVCFKFTLAVSMQDFSQDKGKQSSVSTMQINIMIKNMLKNMGLREMGRQKKYYDAKKIFSNKIDYPTEKDIYCHSGLATSTIFCERGTMVQLDYTNRVINKKTLLDFMNDYKTDEEAAENLVGKTVIASYGNHRNYRIDGFYLNKTPLSTFNLSKTGKDITFKQYYLQTYQVAIKDDKQPLAFNKDKITGAEVILVPELMITTGISDKQRSDYKFMNAIAEYTKLTPDQRVEKFKKMEKEMCDAAAKVKIIQILPGSNLTNGFQFNTPKIKLSKQFDPIQGGVFQIRNSILQPMTLKNWVFIYASKGKRDDETADRFIDELKTVCKGFGIQVENPGFITTKDENGKSFVNELKADIKKNGNPDFVLSMSFGKWNAYSEIKDYLLGEVGVPHSHFTIKSWEKSKLSGVTKIVTQINAKMGKPVWEVEAAKDIPANLMLIGIDSCSFIQKGKKKTVIGVVATLNLNHTQTWSKAIIAVNDEKSYNIVNSIGEVVQEAVQAYLQNNKVLPTHIIMYKDGSGSSQIPVIVKEEISRIQDGFSKIDAKYKPEFVYIMFNKKVNFRFFEQATLGGQQRGGKGNNATFDNPNPGSLIYNDVVGQNFEFYLVPQKVTQGSATPTKYTVCYNTSNFEHQTITQFTYFQCYNYFNWSGAVRVPGVAQYAKKLAGLVGDNFKRPVHDKLRLGQYYL